MIYFAMRRPIIVSMMPTTYPHVDETYPSNNSLIGIFNTLIIAARVKQASNPILPEQVLGISTYPIDRFEMPLVLS